MSKYKIGVISDTHGLLREEALAELKNSDLIIHAGDICDSEILQKLNSIAKVVAVRGNCDRGEYAYELNNSETIEIADILIYVIHDISYSDIDFEAAGIKVVISGHSHSAVNILQDGILHLNPGSIGPRRFSLPISMAVLYIEEGKAHAEIIEL